MCGSIKYMGNTVAQLISLLLDGLLLPEDHFY